MTENTPLQSDAVQKPAPDATTSGKTESAYVLLRREILDNNLIPGMPLRANELKARYGIGWTPLREALSRLEAERLVCSQLNQGFSVAPVSLSELESIRQARQAIELPLLAESLHRGNNAWEERLVIAHHRLRRCPLPDRDPTDGAISRWLDAHDAFHVALLCAAESPWLMHLYRQTMDQERRHHRYLMFRPLLDRALTGGRQGHAMETLVSAMSIDKHDKLLYAALDRDQTQAAALMSEHISLTERVFFDTLSMNEIETGPSDERSPALAIGPQADLRPARQINQRKAD